ncbi:protoporphyrinogen/coproporphyrinogen oxidase [Kineothrix sp. MB12-C1]|uniref:protoporphyrinogen/coproporphyrinogen oxidase n=1 Tax=Kineothrix sp. MB12-C1 TaxID=3070215 RepID=UPI0027D1FCED|nr:FAD-dependent oxidoreductase [Kineothrix sp. MB12-C1]WMC91731.1 FAD-dependent oxidoreductase [Kineothrix sp. MB12-C1]
MGKVKYLILGAGPAGLTFANRLQQKGETSFLVLEKEEKAGGLCRSEEVDGSPLDIGGGHFLDVRRPEVVEFLFGFMPEEEWDSYERDSRISFDGGYIHHPFEANIWEMRPEKQQEYLSSIEQAGCNQGEAKPKEFVDWISWKLGKKIAEDYMLPYNEKMFGKDLNALGTYWLEKLPNVSYEETKLSCEKRQAYGSQPGHAQFYYPKKYGYGELWLRMRRALGDKLITKAAVSALDMEKKLVTCTDGKRYEAEMIITTIPWMEFNYIEGLPEAMKTDIGRLKYSSIQIEYVPEQLDTQAHWIYYPQRQIPYHRILVRHNFCPGSKGYWTETNKDRVKESGSGFRYMNEYAYPLNTIEKPEIMEGLLRFSKGMKVYALGRWGEHEHYNSDAVAELAMELADELMERDGKIE